MQTLPAHKVCRLALTLWSLTSRQTHSGGQIQTGEGELSNVLELELQVSLQEKKKISGW